MKRGVGFIARGLTEGGVTRFVLSVLEQFNQTENYNFYIFTDREDFKDRFKNLDVIYLKRSNKLYWDYVKSVLTLRNYDLDVIFYPKNIIPLSHKLIPAKKINIIHDLGYFYKDLNAYGFLDTLFMRTFMRSSCQMANKVIAVSESTRDDITSILKIDPNKIEVVHEAVGPEFKKVASKKRFREVAQKYHLQQPLLFYCGSLSPRKNILRMLKAFDTLKNRIPHHLYLASGRGWNDDTVKKHLKEKLSSRAHLLPHLPQEDLITIYSLADLYLYPSLHEGFGLPILEAQACGCPVLTSKLTSCPEVAGDGAHLVDPYSVAEIKHGILKILKDLRYREELIRRGYQNQKRFSWKKTADELLKAAALS